MAKDEEIVIKEPTLFSFEMVGSFIAALVAISTCISGLYSVGYYTNLGIGMRELPISLGDFPSTVFQWWPFAALLAVLASAFYNAFMVRRGATSYPTLEAVAKIRARMEEMAAILPASEVLRFKRNEEEKIAIMTEFIDKRKERTEWIAFITSTLITVLAIGLSTIQLLIDKMGTPANTYLSIASVVFFVVAMCAYWALTKKPNLKRRSKFILGTILVASLAASPVCLGAKASGNQLQYAEYSDILLKSDAAIRAQVLVSYEKGILISNGGAITFLPWDDVKSIRYGQRSRRGLSYFFMF